MQSQSQGRKETDIFSANNELGPLQRAFKYLIAFKSHDFCDVGVIVPVLELMRLGLREVEFSPEVMQLQLGSARSSPKHWVLTTPGSH